MITDMFLSANKRKNINLSVFFYATWILISIIAIPFSRTTLSNYFLWLIPLSLCGVLAFKQALSEFKFLKLMIVIISIILIYFLSSYVSWRFISLNLLVGCGILENISLKENIKKVITSLVLILLLSLNFPLINAMNSLKVFEIRHGWLSITDIILLFLLVLLLINQVLSQKTIFIKITDLLMVSILFLLHFNYSSPTPFFFWILRVVVVFYIGRFLVNEDKIAFFLKIFKIMILIQVFFVFFPPIAHDFTGAIRGGLFRYHSNFVNSSGRAMGTLGHPVVTASFLLPGAVLFLNSLLDSPTLKSRILNGLSTVLVMYSVFLTYTRGSWLSLILTLPLILFHSSLLSEIKTFFGKVEPKKKKKYLLLLIMLIIIILLLLRPVVETILLRLLTLNMDNISVFHRLYMFKWSWRYMTSSIQSFLFGYGRGNIHSLLYLDPPPTNILVVDNQYLSFLLEMGIIGFGLLMMIFSIALKSSFANQEMKVFGLMMIGTMINAMTFELIGWFQVSIPFVIILGISTGLKGE